MLLWLVGRMCSRRHVVTAASTLVIAPHQDDETLGCGGLIALKRQLGARVTVVYLTDGTQGTPRDEPGLAAVAPDEPGAGSRLLETRRFEALSALNRLGVSSEAAIFLNLPDGGLSILSTIDRKAVIDRLRESFHESNAAEIFVPHRHDGHPDHDAAFALGVAAIARTERPCQVFEYPVWLWRTQPLFLKLKLHTLRRAELLTVSSVRAKKREAMACHASQLSRFPDGFMGVIDAKFEILFRAENSSVST